MDDAILLRYTGDIASAQATLEVTRAAEHPQCHLCGPLSDSGLKLDFRATAAGVVRAEFNCLPVFQSYPKLLHGGITSALLDAAMTNSLFSLGVVAVTAELTVRYVSPVNLGCQVEILGKFESCDSPLYFLSAEMRQRGYAVARAKAKFFKKA